MQKRVAKRPASNVELKTEAKSEDHGGDEGSAGPMDGHDESNASSHSDGTVDASVEPERVKKRPASVGSVVAKRPSAAPEVSRPAATEVSFSELGFCVKVDKNDLKVSSIKNFGSRYFHKARSAALSEGLDHDVANALGRAAYRETSRQWFGLMPLSQRKGGKLPEK